MIHRIIRETVMIFRFGDGHDALAVVVAAVAVAVAGAVAGDEAAISVVVMVVVLVAFVVVVVVVAAARNTTRSRKRERGIDEFAHDFHSLSSPSLEDFERATRDGNEVVYSYVMY